MAPAPTRNGSGSHAAQDRSAEYRDARTTTAAQPGVPGLSAAAFRRPARRHPGDNERRRLEGGEQRFASWLGEQRLGGDPDDALNGERCVGEQSARVAPAAARIAGRADELQRGSRSRGEPGCQLERRPIVLRAAERHENASIACPLDCGTEEEGQVGRRVPHGRGIWADDSPGPSRSTSSTS